MKALVALVALCAAACALTRSTPEIRYFAVALTTPRTPPLRCAVRVGPMTVDQAYASSRIAERSSPYEITYDAFERWAAPPRALVQAALRDVLDQDGDEPVVEVTGDLRRFEGVADGDTMHGAVTLALRATRGGRLLVDRTYAEDEPATADDAEAIAAAVSRALTRIVEQFRLDVAAAPGSR